MAQHAEEKKDKDKLALLAADDISYGEWLEKQKNVVETLKDFESVSLNSAILVGHLSVIKPRRYSIASTPQGKNISLVVGVVEYNTIEGVPKKGLTTGYLNALTQNTTIPGFIKYPNKVHFKLPDDPSWPIIMIAAGSGIAPFRGFWQRRWEQQKKGEVVGKTILYFGCRKKSMNLFNAETEAMMKSKQGLVSSLIKGEDHTLMDFDREVAYSREPGPPKQYVQNLVKRDSAKIYDLWCRNGGYIYICGKIQMADDVGKTIIDTLKHLGNMDAVTAKETLEDMRKQGRYQEDIFG